MVLELFTSEGCSSCPPADALLAELGSDPGVVALELHVDYWDSLGWKDPFSQAAFTERQQRYGEVLAQNGVYTPELVVNGAAQGVGSNRKKIEKLIAAAPAASVPLTVKARRDKESVVVSARVEGTPPRGAELLVALTESGLVTDVAHGENAGKRLPHGAVVRNLQAVPASGELRLGVPAGAHPEKLSVVAILQDRETLRILGVARAGL